MNFDSIRPNHDGPAPEPSLDPLASVLHLDEPTKEQMLLYYDDPNSRPKGETTHIVALDAIFKWVPGWTNLTTAQPGVGKSEFKRQTLLLRAAHDQKKSLLWVPEDMPREAFYNMLIHSLTGKTTNTETGYALSRPYYEKAMEWVREYFYVLQPVKGQGKTPGHVIDIFEAARAKLLIEHFVIDPWHKLDHSGLLAAGGIQPYLTQVLDLVTNWCSETNTYLDITINPRSITRSPNEPWPVPDIDHLSGGPTWADFAATTTAYDRPSRHVNRSGSEFAIYTRKIKNYTRAGARPGSIGQGSETPDVLIDFDWKSARYTFNGIAPLDHPAIFSLYGDTSLLPPEPPEPDTPPPAPPKLKPPTPLGGGIRFRRDIEDDFNDYAEANTPPA